jgi:replicative DNA helicase
MDLVTQGSSGGGISLTGRTAPHSIEAEMAVLGAILTNERAIDMVADLRAEDFYHPSHKLVYAAAVALSERGRQVDLITIHEELRAREQLEEVGGSAYLSELQLMVPFTLHTEEYARIVQEHSRRRRLLQAAFQVIDYAYDETRTTVDAVDRAQQVIFDATTERDTTDFVPLADLLRETMNEIEVARTENKRVRGVPSGFYDLDHKTSGFQKGNLIILAARPSMGKSSMALNVAEHVAINEKIPVAMFSLEMSKQELVARILCSMARVNSNDVRTGQLSDEALTRIVRALGPLEQAPIYLNDQPIMSVMTLRAKARRLKALEPNLGLIIVDYLQLMAGEGSRREDNRVQEISLISRSLKGLARELDVPVMALSQLNRAPEARTGDEKGRPMLADIRESGSIEQDADVVMFIYRPEVYQRDAPPEVKGTAEIILAKHRNGPTGSVHLRFFGNYTRFENMDRTGRQG